MVQKPRPQTLTFRQSQPERETDSFFFFFRRQVPGTPEAPCR